jgi:hypothetical protein
VQRPQLLALTRQFCGCHPITSLERPDRIVPIRRFG